MGNFDIIPSLIWSGRSNWPMLLAPMYCIGGWMIMRNNFAR